MLDMDRTVLRRDSSADRREAGQGRDGTKSGDRKQAKMVYRGVTVQN